MEKDEIFFKKNVPYRITVRSNMKDTEGTLLDEENPFISVDQMDLRKFIQANKYALDKGLLIEIDEPPLERISVNSLTDEQAAELVKNYHQLKKRLPEFTSDIAVRKLLDAAKATKRAEGTIKLLTERYEELSPEVMSSVTNG